MRLFHNGEIQMTEAYTVELRFSDENLQPLAVSNALGIEFSFDSRDLKYWSDKKNIPTCGYNGHNIAGFKNEWPTLIEGLEFIIKFMNEKKKEILSLYFVRQKFLWCGHFSDQSNHLLELPVGIISQLNDFEIPIFVDTYISGCELR
jgi:hypothetical protein